jgi:hypothetical protein
MTRPFASRAERRRSGRRLGRGDHRAALQRALVIGPTPRGGIDRRSDTPAPPDEDGSGGSGGSRHSAAGPTRRRPWAWLAAGTVLGLLIGLLVAVVVRPGPDGVQLGPVGVVTDPPPAPPAAAGSRGTWGERVTTPDGVAIEVAQPAPYTPSPQATGHDRDRAVLVTTTIVNGSDAPFVLNTFAVGPTATHRGRPAARIFDVAGSLVPAVPVTTVRPGAVVTYRTAFSIDPASGQLVLDYAPGAVFAGEA